MTLSKHRISFNLDTPVRLFGCTKDELFLGILGFSIFTFSSHKLGGLMVLGLSLGAIILLKKIKKQISGFRVASFVYWHFGKTLGPFTLAPSWIRRIN